VAATASQVPITAIINSNSGPPNSDYIHGLDELFAASVTMLGIDGVTLFTVKRTPPRLVRVRLGNPCEKRHRN
jgi:hypothetical protein